MLLRANEQLKRLDIAHLATRPIHTLSFGQRRLVSLAGTLVVEPDGRVIDQWKLCSEPVSHLG